MPEYSVLMAIYEGEKPAFFEEALQSVLEQTLPPNQFVLVCDGPLNTELERVIEKYSPLFGDRLDLLRKTENTGLGDSLALGVLACRNQFIMRADSDDISIPERAKIQLDEMVEKNIDILSSPVILFSRSPQEAIGERDVPKDQERIAHFAKSRSPFNHPAVMFRRQVVLDAGNYSSLFRYRQDYDLWVRCIQNGATCANLGQPVVFMRESENLVKRRKNRIAYLCSVNINKRMRKTRFVSFGGYVKNRFLCFCQFHLPTPIIRLAYKHLHKAKK